MDQEDLFRAIMAEVRDNSNTRARSAGAMSMGDLCTALGTMPQDARLVIDGPISGRAGARQPTALYSYRGYYERLALGWGDEHDETKAVGGWYEPGKTTGVSAVEIKTPATVGDMIDALNLSNGLEFEGYKGGQFRMGWDTWIHVADYDSSGPAVAGVREIGGTVVIHTVEVD